MIDEISFQTNLLSLNAGVEAARAGPAGVGFAVVASEVGALAQRASEATLEIKELVEESERHVLAGSDLVGETGEALHKISEEITRVDTVLERVSEGSKTQVSSLKDLSVAMNQINNLAGQNTVMADETRSSSREIAKRSQDLASAIGDFKLSLDGTSLPKDVVEAA